MLLVLFGMEWFVVYFGRLHEVGVENEESKASPEFYPRGFVGASWTKYRSHFGRVWTIYAMLIASFRRQGSAEVHINEFVPGFSSQEEEQDIAASKFVFCRPLPDDRSFLLTLLSGAEICFQSPEKAHTTCERTECF